VPGYETGTGAARGASVTQRVWDEDGNRYIEIAVRWSGQMHRANEASCSLLGDGYQYPENVLVRAAPSKRDQLTVKDKQNIANNAVPADTGMHQLRAGRGNQLQPIEQTTTVRRDVPKGGAKCHCGERVANWEYRQGVRRCKPCRTAHPAKGQEAAA
jgi:hypothetical protein